MLADLNTPEALGRCFRLVRELSEAFERGEYEGNDEALNEVRQGFQATCDAFGLVVEPKEENTEEAPGEIQDLAQRRWEAKQAKDWPLADQLRDELLSDSPPTEDMMKVVLMCRYFGDPRLHVCGSVKVGFQTYPGELHLLVSNHPLSFHQTYSLHLP